MKESEDDGEEDEEEEEEDLDDDDNNELAILAGVDNQLQLPGINRDGGGGA